MYDSKNGDFLKGQETSALLSNLGLKLCLSKIPLLSDILFQRYKKNETVNKFLIAGDKLITEMNLRQPAFTYSACRPFTKSKEKIKETGDSRYASQNRLDKTCF